MKKTEKLIIQAAFECKIRTSHPQYLNHNQIKWSNYLNSDFSDLGNWHNDHPSSKYHNGYPHTYNCDVNLKHHNNHHKVQKYERSDIIEMNSSPKYPIGIVMSRN